MHGLEHCLEMQEVNCSIFPAALVMGSPFPPLASTKVTSTGETAFDETIIPVGEPVTNEEMADDATSHPNNPPSWPHEDPKEATELPATLDHDTTTNSDLEPTSSPNTNTSSPKPSVPFHDTYLCDLISGINVEVQVFIRTMSENTPMINQSLNIAHNQIVGLNKAVYTQASTITSHPPTQSMHSRHTLLQSPPRNTHGKEPKAVPPAPSTPKEVLCWSHWRRLTSPTC